MAAGFYCKAIVGQRNCSRLLGATLPRGPREKHSQEYVRLGPDGNDKRARLSGMSDWAQIVNL